MHEAFLIEEDLFAPGQGHLIWFDVPPNSHMNYLPLDIGYQAHCMVFEQGIVYFEGIALLKKRRQKRNDSVVILVPDRNLGKIPLGSSVEVNLKSLVEKKTDTQVSSWTDLLLTSPIGISTTIAGNQLNVRIHLLSAIMSPDTARDFAQNMAVTLFNVRNSPTFSGLAWDTSEALQVDIIIELGDRGSISGEMRSHTRLGFADNHHIIRIYEDDLHYGYVTTDGGVERYTLQHLLNHELAHVLTGQDDTPEFLALVNEINAETEAGPARDLDYNQPPVEMPEFCFPAGTLIHVATGQVSIESLHPGDLVLAFDPSGDLGRGALVPKRVVRLFHNETEEWLRLTWREGSEECELTVTPGHRFLDTMGNFRRIDEIILAGQPTVVLADGALTPGPCRADRLVRGYPVSLRGSRGGCHGRGR